MQSSPSLPTLSPAADLAAVRRELAERSLAEYTRQVWSIVEPATTYLHGWHIDYMAEHLEAVTDGEITRLLLNIPPRYMKSLLVSVAWPTWEWGAKGRPSLRYLFASYAASLATKHSVDRRRIIEHAWYQANWPHVMLTSDQNQKTEYENTARGVMVSTSVGGTATGKGGNRLVIDDPVNPTEAYSDTKRETANEFFDKTLSTRLDDKKRDAIVVVMQRIHDDDLAGHVLEQSPDEWTVVKVPAEAERRHVVTFPRSLREIVREPGDILWPEREGRAELDSVKRLLGSRDYSAQYQQEPAPPAGAMVQTAWWRFYREAPANLEELLQSWDMTFKDTTGTDYVVGQVWGRRGAEKYLLDQVRDRMDFPTTLTAVRLLTAKWPRAQLKLVEDKANGPAVIATLNAELGGFVPIEPDGGKVARVAAVSPAIEAGNVYLPDPQYVDAGDRSWVPDYVLEWSRFPAGTHDDQVDASSQALNRLRYSAPREIVTE